MPFTQGDKPDVQVQLLQGKVDSRSYVQHSESLRSGNSPPFAHQSPADSGYLGPAFCRVEMLQPIGGQVCFPFTE